MTGLTKKEKAFCVGFLDTGSVTEAEKYAGLKKGGNELICRKDICDEIQRLSAVQSKSLSQVARAGLKRLAMGSIADAVSLIYMDSPDRERLKDMDLFMISEIRRKDNATEIKFFDRFKALNELADTCESREDAAPFYDALIKGAEFIRSNEDGD